MAKAIELPQGTLELLILETLWKKLTGAVG
jgi:hypothetical protein